MDLYEKLRAALRQEIEKHNLAGQNICVRCNALTVKEAIGTPEHDDYPIQKGKEVMVEAVFNGSKGQAFSDEYKNADYPIDDLLNISLDSNKNRAIFIASLNAVFNHLNLCTKTIHCRDKEPVECASVVENTLAAYKKILLIGFQPRFLEKLSQNHQIRVIDLDADNIGKTVSGVVVESADSTADAIKWCDAIFATGSTIVNGTTKDFIDQNKPVVFYGTTISAAAEILNLKRYCNNGH